MSPHPKVSRDLVVLVVSIVVVLWILGWGAVELARHNRERRP